MANGQYGEFRKLGRLKKDFFVFRFYIPTLT